MASLHDDKVIYAIGGLTSGKNVLNTVEKFTIGSTSWKNVASMNHVRNDHDAVAYGNSIYVCGDGFYHTNMRTCERYDSDSDKWTNVANTNAAYMDFAFVKFNDYLVALGSGQPDETQVVEYYDPVADKWATTTKLLEYRDWACGVAL